MNVLAWVILGVLLFFLLVFLLVAVVNFIKYNCFLFAIEKSNLKDCKLFEFRKGYIFGDSTLTEEPNITICGFYPFKLVILNKILTRQIIEGGLRDNFKYHQRLRNAIKKEVSKVRKQYYLQNKKELEELHQRVFEKDKKIIELEKEKEALIISLNLLREIKNK